MEMNAGLEARASWFEVKREGKGKTMQSTRMFLFMIPAAAVLLTACSGAPFEDNQGEEQGGTLEQALPAGCAQLDSSLISHVCTHPTLGPFQSINGSASPPVAITADHTYVTLSLNGASPHVGSARYSPVATDDFAVHFAPGTATVTVKDKTGATVPSALSGSNSTCSPALGAYKIYPLSSSSTKKPYTITVSSAAAGPAYLVVEQLTPQSRYWYIDGDHDGWGLSSSELKTYCAPPVTHTVNQGLDCNDANASLYPGHGC